ncbi:glycosyltransferase [Rhodoglobus sp. NPDC076762]
MAKLRSGIVSVVLVNFRGADDTIEAIRHLGQLDWPQDRLEIVVVENASGDDSAQRIREAAPHVKLVVSAKNEGFAGGCNRGVAASTGEFVAFLNNDAKPDTGWVRAAVQKFEESEQIGAVASRVLDWDGELVDFIGAALTWYGMGYKPFTAEPVPRVPEKAQDVLFGTGAAMFVRRSVYDALGGFDERYFMFFEDVDFGWRLNLRGWRFAYVPDSLAFHKHHASMAAFGPYKETYLLERNALFTLFKNLEEPGLLQTLPAALSLALRRGITRAELDSTSFDLRKPGGDDADSIEISKQAVAPIFAIDQLTENLPSLRASREEIQASRTVSDAMLWRLFGMVDAPVYQAEPYLDGYENLVSTFDVLTPTERKKVLIITGDPIGIKLAGPAIRAWNMAEQLAVDNDVAVLSLSGVEPLEAPFALAHVRPGDDRSFLKYEAWADVIVFQGHAMAVFSALQTTDKIMVVDIYDPMHLEQLEQGRELPAAQWAQQVADATHVLNDQLQRGDFFLCASDRQKMFWLGQLAALGRINPATYEGDPDLNGLISIVPFGLSSTPPVHVNPVLKDVRPGIGKDDKVLLWSGGLYNWFDPKTLIRAVATVSERRDNVRLFFQGTKHPHPGVPEMRIVAESRELASDLGVLDTSVFFNDSWVDYSERQNYLTEADAGVSTHFSHIETTFSFRTRILDYLWAELPMVVTEGDHFAELVEKEGLGIVVEAGNEEQLATALERVLFDDEFIARARVNIHRVRERYYWETALAPLVQFVTTAHKAGDSQTRLGGGVSGVGKPKRRRRAGTRHDIERAFFYLRSAGLGVVLSKVRRRLRQR